MNNLREQIVKSFNDNIINVNGKEYVSIDVFQSAVSELALLESLVGSVALKLNKDIFVSDEEAIEYITEKHDMVDIDYKNGFYTIKIKNKK